MRLDYFASTPPAGSISGTNSPGPGVGTLERCEAKGEEALAAHRGLRLREWLWIALVGWSLLGLGERCRANPHLTSPSATLHTYWEALRAGDEEGVAECMQEGPHDMPFPGMLWFLPPTRALWLDGFQTLPIQSGRLLVTYQVHYLPEGSREMQSFPTGHELERTRGEWRIARPLGEAGMPQWRPIPRAVTV